MKTASGHLTYCTNIHPGESWGAVFDNVRTHVLAVKQRVAPTLPFGVGLRLSAAAARELSAPDELARFKEFLAAQQLYVFTINGFPYGPFHGQPVKAAVYRPDWREAERRRYTDLLDSLQVAPETPERMRAAARKVDDLRYAATHTPAVSDTDVDAP